MSYSAQRFTTKKPVLPADTAIKEHFVDVADFEAEMRWVDDFYLYDPFPLRFEYEFDDFADLDFERSAYFYDPPLIDDDLVLEDAWADRYEL